MTDGLAECYLTGVGMNRGAINLVETALEAVEIMRGRIYVRAALSASAKPRGERL